MLLSVWLTWRMWCPGEEFKGGVWVNVVGSQASAATLSEYLISWLAVEAVCSVCLWAGCDGWMNKWIDGGTLRKLDLGLQLQSESGDESDYHKKFNIYYFYSNYIPICHLILSDCHFSSGINCSFLSSLIHLKVFSCMLHTQRPLHEHWHHLVEVMLIAHLLCVELCYFHHTKSSCWWVISFIHVMSYFFLFSDAKTHFSWSLMQGKCFSKTKKRFGKQNTSQRHIFQYCLNITA